MQYCLKSAIDYQDLDAGLTINLIINTLIQKKNLLAELTLTLCPQ